MTANIHKNHIYIKPKPKQDVPDGLHLFMSNGKEMTADIYGGIKKYDLPPIPPGVSIVTIIVKDAE